MTSSMNEKMEEKKKDRPKSMQDRMNSMKEKGSTRAKAMNDWVMERTYINRLPFRKTPDYMRKWGGKWYWTGSLVTVAFVWEVLTGVILLLYYNPSAPFATTQYIITGIPFGKLILSTHLYGAYAMIILVYIHMFRNYFAGAYKKPRELQWIIGVLLLALTIGVGYFGYSLTGDVLSYDAQDVGKGIAALVPVIGKWLVLVGFGNGTAVSLFSKFLGFHIIFAGLIALVFGYHFYLAEANTIMPSGKLSGYKAPAKTPETDDMKPWYPSNLLYILEITLFAIGFIIFIPSFVGSFPNVPILISPFPGPSPTSALAALIPPYPPWFLLFAYKAVDFRVFTSGPGPLEAMVVWAIIPLIYFLLVPFLDRSNKLHPLDRPFFTSLGIISIVWLIVMSVWGAYTPGILISSPDAALVLLPPAALTFILIYAISRAWKKGRMKVGPKSITTSFFIFIAGLVVTMILTGYSFTHLLSQGGLSSLGKFALSSTSVIFMAVGTAKTSSDLPDKKFKKVRIPIGGYVAVGLLTLIAWVLLALSIKLNVITQQMTVGLVLGTVLIIGGIVMAIYRKIVFDE